MTQPAATTTPERRSVQRPIRAALGLVTGVVALLALSGCVPNNPTTEGDATATLALTVDSSADSCTVSAAEAPSGSLAFTITNSGDQVTEFYLLADDGLRIVGEVENIGPGITRDLVVQAKPGDYYTVCKPGMIGDGIGRTAFTVTDSGADLADSGDDAEAAAAAATNYVAYVKDQIEALVPATTAFLDAYRAGDDDTARSLYALTRASYERIEPVAESFGDLDPKIDFREADVEEGTEWTGWHRIEKDLWPPAAEDNNGEAYVPLTAAERAYFSDLLQADTGALNDAVHEADYTVSIDAISNGAIGLLDEVASGKITGEEEIWSHTDLWDFQANLEGARVAFEGVRDIVEPKDPELVAQIDEEFTALQSELAAYGSLDAGFVSYTELTTEQVKDLANGVNALSEPLSKLTAVLVG
ncbi:iron uptake system component EfeO [Glaciihabitans tibetensis]|uniref:Iron uptake system component EfeO n=1 Tax=Glaciihabitans tibetensis TaxID=1266600 RepID=A0A2T0VGR6_9MICO|nr:iron uptake system protein EfeO [Glaciihabitans tibetensis]PRY69416.1 iron uptake system component EfeO [Glaciihabitans tibetensis]